MTCTCLQQIRFSSSVKDNKGDKILNKKVPKNLSPPQVIPFMPVVNIPIAELASNAFYSLHRPLLGLSSPKPFMAGNLVGQIKKEETDNCKFILSTSLLLITHTVIS